jgi:hypothetical protein
MSKEPGPIDFSSQLLFDAIEKGDLPGLRATFDSYQLPADTKVFFRC